MIGSAALMLRLSREFGKREKFRCGASWDQSISRPVIARSDSDEQSMSPQADRWNLRYARNDEEMGYRPGRNSRLSNPAAMPMPTWPCTLSGCSAIEFAEPPTSTLPPTPTPSVALPCAPT